MEGGGMGDHGAAGIREFGATPLPSIAHGSCVIVIQIDPPGRFGNSEISFSKRLCRREAAFWQFDGILTGPEIGIENRKSHRERLWR
jgi:hypothetical protein